MSDGLSCRHVRITVKELPPLPDGTPVLRGCCLDCGKSDTEPLWIEYAPHPVQVGTRWLPIVQKRGGLAVCAACGRPLFPHLSLTPVMLFVRNEGTGTAIGEMDFCPNCGGIAMEATA